MAVEVRAITEDQLTEFIGTYSRAFGNKLEDGEAERTRDLVGLDRCVGAFDGKQLVGTAGTYGLRLSVPGTDQHADPEPVDPAGVATAGLTRVSVAATHRRRGILGHLVDAHFADAAAHDEPLSGLWASELAIYGRYGYGPGSDGLRVSYDARRVGLRPPERPDELRFVDVDEAKAILPGLREAQRLGRPGHYHRSPRWWELRLFADHPYWGEGASPRRFVVAFRAGQPVGYAVFRQAPRWTEDDLADGQVRVIEVDGVDLAARHTLWSFLSTIDLHPHVHFWSLPLDCELFWLATDRRAFVRRLTDGLQLRVLDPKVLEARRWSQPGQLVFELDDRRVTAAAGRYRLSVDADGQALVEPTEQPAEATLLPAALGGLYLGSGAPRSLAAAGWLDAPPPVLDYIERLFSWPVAAWCDELF